MSRFGEGRMTLQDSTRREYDDMMGPPWMGLVYLVFVFVPLLFWDQSPARSWLASVAALAA